jgi:hypothetical protein
MMHAALLRASQKREMRALRYLELEHENLNVAVAHEIGETYQSLSWSSMMVVIVSD